MNLLRRSIEALDTALTEMYKSEVGEMNQAELAAACIRFVQFHGIAAGTALKAAEEIAANGVYSLKNREILEGLERSGAY